MKFSENWLRSFVNPPISTESLSHLLTMSGLEVEETTSVAPSFDGVVVAQVLSLSKHPDADRLNVCLVDVGDVAPVQIVCGAANVAAGIKVPCARIGAQLPNGMAIKAVKMRGVESFGMLCSAKELGLSEESEGLMILDNTLAVGQSIRQSLDLDDTLFTIKLTPNKADCLSVMGIAREVTALTRTSMTAPPSKSSNSNLNEKLGVRIEAPDLCGRFAGRIIRGVNAHAATPAWMKQRLERSGLRSISILVDISNYLMLEWGIPSHIYDLDKIKGNLTVRWANPGEELKLLNGETIQLKQTMGIVADETMPLCLAGIMGGDATAVSLETKNVFIEVAFWWPNAIRGRARELGFSTDSSHRFERGVDYDVSVSHLERMTQFIIDLCSVNGSLMIGEVDNQSVNVPTKKQVRLRVSRANQVIGVSISAAQIAQIFSDLSFEYTLLDDVFEVKVPSYRFDIELEEDLIEEVVRVYGYDNIPAEMPTVRVNMLADREGYRDIFDIRQQMANADYHEVINYSFVERQWEHDLVGNERPLALLNPIASHMAVMRSSLVGGLLANLQHNLNHKASRVRIFEIGAVFLQSDKATADDLSVFGLHQPQRLAALAYGDMVEEQWGQKSRQVDFFDMKMNVENLIFPLQARFEQAIHPAFHPGRSAKILLDGQVIGWIGELHPKWQQQYDLPLAPILFEVDIAPLQQISLATYNAIPKLPAVSRDIAVIVPSKVSAQSLLDSIASAIEKQEACAIIRQYRIFDEYKFPIHTDPDRSVEEKSLAIRLTLQNYEMTLDEPAIAQAIQALLAVLLEKNGAKLRV